MTAPGRPVTTQLRRLHRLAGVWAAAFLAFLAISGIALNHARAIGLDGRVLRSPLIARLYGFGPRQPPAAFALTRGLFVAGPDRWWIVDRAVPALNGEVVGAVQIGEVIYVATPETIALYLPDGRLIDRTGADALPSRPIHRIGRVGQDLAIETPGGAFVSADALAWTTPAAPPDGAVWAAPSGAPLPPAALAQLAPGVSAEQLLRDVHSGRIVGPLGPIVVDLAGIAALGLAASGAWLYVRPRRGAAS